MGIEENSECIYQIVLGMSNQFLITHLGTIVRCRPLVGNQKVADGDYRERFEAWLEDVRGLGLAPVLALTSYTSVYPNSAR